jgi:cytochrome c oxidase subunit I
VAASRRTPQSVPEFAEAISGPEEAPSFLDRLPVWLTASAGLIVIAYGPTLYRLVSTATYDSPGFRVW